MDTWASEFWKMKSFLPAHLFNIGMIVDVIEDYSLIVIR